ncbi:hypothetical protein D3C80_2203460 [compost metagenome]
MVGYYGGAIAKVAELLLNKGLYDFAGSDVHHSNHIASFDKKVNVKEISALKEVIANNAFFKF